VLNVAVDSSHSFSAWKLRNGSWAGFKNNIPGAKSFSAGLIVPVDPETPGGAWRPAGPNLACDGDCGGKGLGWAPVRERHKNDSFVAKLLVGFS
jgi:hypothetical protein